MFAYDARELLTNAPDSRSYSYDDDELVLGATDTNDSLAFSYDNLNARDNSTLAMMR